jgi:hypothetical protein
MAVSFCEVSLRRWLPEAGTGRGQVVAGLRLMAAAAAGERRSWSRSDHHQWRRLGLRWLAAMLAAACSRRCRSISAANAWWVIMGLSLAVRAPGVGAGHLPESGQAGAATSGDRA